MAEILLTSEKFVKSVTSISDNLAGKYLGPSIREAQETGLRTILGDALTDRLKDMVADGSIEQGEQYKDLLDRCQYYLAYRAVIEVTHKVELKLANMGVVKTSDERVDNAQATEVVSLRNYYTAKADGCCRDLQRWLCSRHASFPELSQGDMDRMRANLHSAASCGIWLGGPRGRRR